ncbi:7585_t:CDS:2 [Dentiscutata erythropus]|uniref:7585_t:CDS:1 n=1 Tax=Dentiscutata erythropus TaxID=1348616 RepID=A0A9N9GHD2_9GLOM|nr:7585_t:CDS:2 [Dentiscutata erythropus]
MIEEVIDLEEEKEIILETSYLETSFLNHHLSGCRFYNNGDLVIGAQVLFLGETYYKIFIFSSDLHKQSWGFPFRASHLYERDYNNRFVLGTYKSQKFYEKLEFEAKIPNIENLYKEICGCKKNSPTKPNPDSQESPFISETLKRIAKLNEETDSKKDTDINKILEEIHKIFKNRGYNL